MTKVIFKEHIYASLCSYKELEIMKDTADTVEEVTKISYHILYLMFLSET
jgi:hypothetical protein